MWNQPGKSIEVHTIDLPGQRGLVMHGMPMSAGPLSLSKEIRAGAEMAKMDTRGFHEFGKAIARELADKGFAASAIANGFDTRAHTFLRGERNRNGSLSDCRFDEFYASCQSDYALLLDLEIAAVRVRRSAFGIASRPTAIIEGALLDVAEKRIATSFRVAAERSAPIVWRDEPSVREFAPHVADALTAATQLLARGLFDEPAAWAARIALPIDPRREALLDEILAIRERSKDYMGLNGCKKFYPLTQNCSKKDKAGLGIRISGYDIGCSANDSGDVVYMKLLPYSGHVRYGDGLVADRSAIYSALYELYSLIRDSGISVTKIDSINIDDSNGGFFIVADKPIYPLIQALASL